MHAEFDYVLRYVFFIKLIIHFLPLDIRNLLHYAQLTTLAAASQRKLIRYALSIRGHIIKTMGLYVGNRKEG
jgi:hypothetical protein